MLCWLSERELEVEMKTKELKDMAKYEQKGRKIWKHDAKIPSFRNQEHYHDINKNNELGEKTVLWVEIKR